MVKKVRVIFTVQGTSVHGWVQSLATPEHLCQLFISYSHTKCQSWINVTHMHTNEEDTCFHSVTYLFFSSLGADFVTGVPKGLMLYGLVSDPHVLLAQNSIYRIVHVQNESS